MNITAIKESTLIYREKKNDYQRDWGSGSLNITGEMVSSPADRKDLGHLALLSGEIEKERVPSSKFNFK